MLEIGIIGAGSFGTALGIIAAAKGHSVRIWGRNSSQMKKMREERENAKYLPGVKLPEGLDPVSDREYALLDADLVISSVPAQAFRDSFRSMLPYIPETAVVVNVAKGIEKGTMKRMSEIALEEAPQVRYVVLSGPSHAEEVARFLPTTVAAAGRNSEDALFVQDALMTDRFRIYTGTDVVGMELGGSLKNIIALAAGISDGLGYGDNAKAALMTRGLAEITRLGLKLGARPETLSGLAGVGDLIVTCTSMHSRNRRCGIMIGEGVPVDEAVSRVGMVVEGITTTEAAKDLADRSGVEMPITEAMYDIIHGNITAAQAEPLLMGRAPKAE